MSEPRRGPWQAIRDAAADREGGAAEIARRAAESLAALPRADLEAAVRALVRGHPSMAPLRRLGTEVLSAEDHRIAAASFARRLEAEREAVAAAAAALIDGPVVVHSYSSAMVAAVSRARVPALCARSDPGGEGIDTARRLEAAGLEVRVVEDAEAVRAATDGRLVVVGADAVGPGGVVNKVGTRALAGAAARSLVVAGSSKLAATDLPADPPFERTALSSFSAIVTEDGPLSPGEAARKAARFALHPAIR